MAVTFYPSLSLAATIVVFAGLTLRCITPPNPNKGNNGWKHDRLGFFASHTFTNGVGVSVMVLFILHVALVCTGQSNGPPSLPFCPHPERLNPSLFTWNPFMAISLFATILVGAPLRLQAYTCLGRNFTFGLAAPNKLTTTGIYQYMQHPSYTGLVIILISSFSFLLRWDGAAACFLPTVFSRLVEGWGAIAYAIVMYAFGRHIMTRIHDEEAMLRELFGAEWVKWHHQTARFIPFVF